MKTLMTATAVGAALLFAAGVLQAGAVQPSAQAGHLVVAGR
jgi:hypothetical protein